MKQAVQSQYQVTCECGSYHWVRQRKQNQDKYMCTKCHLTFKVIDKNRDTYIIKDKQVFRKC